MAGATLGQAVRQGARAARGKGFDVGAIPAEAARTATLEGVFRGAGRLAPNIANRLMTSVLKPASRIFQKQPTLGREAVELGLTGSLRVISKKSAQLIERNLNKIDDILKGSKKGVDVTDVTSSLDDLKRRFVNTGNKKGIEAVNEMKRLIFSKVKGRQIPIEKANRLKRDLFAELKDIQFGTGEVAPQIASKKAVTGGLRRGIEAAEPSQPIGILNREIQTGLRTGKAAEGRLAAQEKGALLPFVELGGAGTALAFDKPEIAALIAARRIGGIPVVKSFLAKQLINQSLGRGLTLGSSEIARRLRKE